jgi:hypothetical protein
MQALFTHHDRPNHNEAQRAYQGNPVAELLPRSMATRLPVASPLDGTPRIQCRCDKKHVQQSGHEQVSVCDEGSLQRKTDLHTPMHSQVGSPWQF